MVGNHKVAPWAPFLCHTCNHVIKHFPSLIGLTKNENMSDYQCTDTELIKGEETLLHSDYFKQIWPIRFFLSPCFHDTSCDFSPSLWCITNSLTTNYGCCGLISHRSHPILTTTKTGSQCGGLWVHFFDLFLRVLVARCHITYKSACSLSACLRTLRSTEPIAFWDSETPWTYEVEAMELFQCCPTFCWKEPPFPDHSEAWLKPSSSWSLRNTLTYFLLYDLFWQILMWLNIDICAALLSIKVQHS